MLKWLLVLVVAVTALGFAVSWTMLANPTYPTQSPPKKRFLEPQ